MSHDQIDRIERKINRIGNITILLAAVFFGIITFEAMSRSDSSLVHYAAALSVLVGALFLAFRRPFRR